jgi:hypothetical protein
MKCMIQPAYRVHVTHVSRIHQSSRLEEREVVVGHSVLPQCFRQRSALRHAMNTIWSSCAVRLCRRCSLGLLGANQISPRLRSSWLGWRCRCFGWRGLSSAINSCSLCLSGCSFGCRNGWLLCLLFRRRGCSLRFLQSTNVGHCNRSSCILARVLLCRSTGWLRRGRGSLGRGGRGRNLREIAFRGCLRCSRGLTCRCRCHSGCL